MGYIYKITNKISKKCYIGETKSKNVESRWNQHINTIEKNKGCPALRDAVKKYGWDNFKFEVLIICFDDDRFEYEKQYIKKYNSKVPNGYNTTDGGEGGGFQGETHSEETIKNIKETCRKMYDTEEKRKEHGKVVKEAMKGINIRERMFKSEKWKEAVENMRDGRRKNYNNDEKIEKIRQSVLNYYSENNSIKKHRKIMAKARGKKVCQYSLEGKFIKMYESFSEAERQTGTHRDCISLVTKGKLKHANGFFWKLYENKKEV
jgi:group I intron endonuclease